MYRGMNLRAFPVFCDCEMLLLTFGDLSDVFMLFHSPSIFQLRSKYTTVTVMEYCIT